MAWTAVAAGVSGRVNVLASTCAGGAATWLPSTVGFGCALPGLDCGCTVGPALGPAVGAVVELDGGGLVDAVVDGGGLVAGAGGAGAGSIVVVVVGRATVVFVGCAVVEVVDVDDVEELEVLDVEEVELLDVEELELDELVLELELELEELELEELELEELELDELLDDEVVAGTQVRPPLGAVTLDSMCPMRTSATCASFGLDTMGIPPVRSCTRTTSAAAETVVWPPAVATVGGSGLG